MKIEQDFIKKILVENYPENYQEIYDNSPLLQYLDYKTNAVNKDCKTRRKLANIYAIYSLTYYYVEEFYEDKDKYENFEGYKFKDLKNFCNSLYGGEKLQNHTFNNRANFEFSNRTNMNQELIKLAKRGIYKLNPIFLYYKDYDISKQLI